jgi:hypothetical protein
VFFLLTAEPPVAPTPNAETPLFVVAEPVASSSGGDFISAPQQSDVGSKAAGVFVPVALPPTPPMLPRKSSSSGGSMTRLTLISEESHSSAAEGISIDPKSWDSSATEQWLVSAGQPANVAAVFTANGMSGRDLADLTVVDLISMGVDDVEQQDALLSAVKLLFGAS